ncbi:MAG: lysylphosphatidylglycerol synthase transmembrane domain-containing protein [Bacteroidota bacterium]
MKSKVKIVAKYTLMLTITAFLLWLSFENIEVEEGESKLNFILAIWGTAEKPFLFLSALTALLSHLIRAERWKLLLKPLGYQVGLTKGFLSVMIGYFINLVIPRGGEVSRCYNLYRLSGTPVNISLGTVVAERVVDLLFLILLIGLSFLIELDSLIMFFQSKEVQALRGSTEQSSFSVGLIVSGLLLFLGIFLVFWYLFKTRKYFVLRLISKSKGVILGVRDGAKSVLRLEHRVLFVVYSIGIWVCYYLMMYFVMLAFPETSNLGLGAALTIFVIGGLAMAVPLPGGAGSFHILVATGLILLYSLSQDKAVAFTFIFHGWQTIVIIVVGAFSMFVSQFLKTRSENINEN